LGDREDGHRDWIHGVCFDPAGTALATASHDKTVKLWDLQTGEATTFKGHTDWVRDVDFSPAGDLLASCGKDKTICIWDREVLGHPICILRGHADEVWKVEFLNRNILASASWDQTARLWEIGRGEEIDIFRGYRSPLRFTPYSPDGSSRLYRIHLEELMALAETRRTRSLTAWERKRFLHESNEERV
jgi:WD40 repeat protein